MDSSFSLLVVLYRFLDVRYINDPLNDEQLLLPINLMELETMW